MIQPQQFKTYSLSKSQHGEDICSILATAIDSADAGNAVKRHVHRENEILYVDNSAYNLNNFRSIYILGVGKAVVPMIGAMTNILENRITAGFAITKYGYIQANNNFSPTKIQIIEANHPLPDRLNIDAGRKLLAFIKDINGEDLVIFLLSGGGSALLTYPAAGITIEDIQTTTSILLNSGATINEINTIRKHLDRFKGGGLAKLLYPASVLTLILSDVVGDNLDVIASGPTVPDTTSFEDAWFVLEKYHLLPLIPPSVQARISSGVKGKILENSPSGDKIFEKVFNIVVGNNKDVTLSAINYAEKLGLTCQLLTSSLTGEAFKIGQKLAKDAQALFHQSSSITRPACLIAGGETTVTVKGNGKGGRNQELALGAVNNLSGPNEIILISISTDGGDGPTDAAGAVATNESYSRGIQMGLIPHEYLRRNDSYHYFETLGDLIKTGPTFTNLNDLLFVFVF